MSDQPTAESKPEPESKLNLDPPYLGEPEVKLSDEERALLAIGPAILDRILHPESPREALPAPPTEVEGLRTGPKRKKFEDPRVLLRQEQAYNYYVAGWSDARIGLMMNMDRHTVKQYIKAQWQKVRERVQAKAEEHLAASVTFYEICKRVALTQLDTAGAMHAQERIDRLLAIEPVDRAKPPDLPQTVNAQVNIILNPGERADIYRRIAEMSRAVESIAPAKVIDMEERRPK